MTQVADVMTRGVKSVLAGTALLITPAASFAQHPKAPGADKSTTTRTLEAGAKVLQRKSPLGSMDIYLVGFHPMKDAPGDQMQAHHYCHQVNEDFAQCVLFDSSGPK